MKKNANHIQKLSIAEQAIVAQSGEAVDSTDYLKGLNEEQKKAVLTVEGPLLVLAGAGTGKTRVLTTRIAHILAQKLAWHNQILAVTFTNKAAKEMGERVKKLLNNANVKQSGEPMPWLGTFHSIGAKMLRHHAELVDLTPQFTIIDKDDQVRLLKQIMEAENIDNDRWPARLLLALIDSWKNKCKKPENIGNADNHKFAEGQGRKLYRQYQTRLQTLNACDFGDLLMHPIHIFKDNIDILQKYQNRFRYILVDEYQDTNTAQYIWLQMLAGVKINEKEQINICCVGDDDQAIYGWRDANVKNILNFETDFKDANIIRLERNYRSTSSILACASHLIAHNKKRLGKTLYTDEKQPEGEKIKVVCYHSSEDEASCIGADIESIAAQGYKLNDIAILVRATFQMREFENRFANMGLNYRVFGGPRFYERMEIRDAIAYFRLVSQPKDDLAFERIVNKPKRGLGDTTIQIIRTHAQSQKISMMESAEQLIETQELKTKQKETIRNLMLSFARWREEMDNIVLNELAGMILDESRYTTMWQNDPSIKAPERLENLQELVHAMREFQTLQEFLDHVSLVMENNATAEQDAVTLSTLHAAKGLEFETVFLPGWEENLFPHQRSLEENGEKALEEERRLAYVGLTRAQRHCYVSFANRRFTFTESQAAYPSPFVSELSPEHVEIMTPINNHKENEFMTADNVIPKPQKFEVIENIYSFSIGERVFHMKFGYGNIKYIDGNKLTITFEKAGEKKVVDSFIRPLGQE